MFQAECSIVKLTDAIKTENPILADFLLNSRLVDDLGDSKSDIDSLKKITDDANILFAKVGFACKEWTYTGELPSVGEDDQTVSIGGMKFHSLYDILEVPWPRLHFSKKNGRQTHYRE